MKLVSRFVLTDLKANEQVAEELQKLPETQFQKLSSSQTESTFSNTVSDTNL